VLRIVFDGTDRDQVKARIADLLEKKSIGFEDKEPGELFAQFVLWLIASTRDQKMRLALATIKDYSISVGKRVGGLLGASQIDDLDAVGWAAIFEEVLADANTKGVRTKLVRVLREFLRFLQEEKRLIPARLVKSWGHLAGWFRLMPIFSLKQSISGCGRSSWRAPATQ